VQRVERVIDGGLMLQKQRAHKAQVQPSRTLSLKRNSIESLIH